MKSVSPRSLEKVLDKCVDVRLDSSGDDFFQIFDPQKYDWRDGTLLHRFSVFQRKGKCRIYFCSPVLENYSLSIFDEIDRIVSG